MMIARDSVLLLAVLLAVVVVPTIVQCATPNKLLIISWDGFRADYLNRGLTPNFVKFKESGVSVKKVTPVFPTFTQPCHYSMVTGRQPDHHGIVGNTFYDYDLGFYFEGYNRDPRFWTWNNTQPIWVTAKKQGLKTVNFYWSGGHVSYTDSTGTYRTDMYVPKKIEKRNPWTITVRRILERLSSDYTLGLIHNFEPDSSGHKLGPYDDKFNDTLRIVDDRLAFLMEQISLYGLKDKLNVLLVADHGMEKIDKVINIGTDFNITQAEYWPWTWGGMMFIDVRAQSDRQRIYKLLKTGSPDFETYYREEVPDYLYFGKNPRVAQIVLIPRPGVQLRPGGDLPVIEQLIPVIANLSCSTKPLLPPPIKPPVTIPPEIKSLLCNVSTGQAVQNFLDLVGGHHSFLIGMHGYEGSAPSMTPIFMAAGPDFKKNVTLDKANQVDYYALMTTLLRIKPEPHDGNFETFRSALINPDSFNDNSAASVLHYTTCLLLSCLVTLLQRNH